LVGCHFIHVHLSRFKRFLVGAFAHTHCHDSQNRQVIQKKQTGMPATAQRMISLTAQAERTKALILERLSGREMKTDTQLQTDVLAELRWDPSVNAAQIGVEATNGVVTLTGEVTTFSEKWDVERIAQRVSGVTAMVIDIDVMLPGLSVRSDADIARAADNVLQWMTFASSNPIKVIVEDGWITLSGNMDWEYQRQAALGAVRYLLGVKGVSDKFVFNEKQASNKLAATQVLDGATLSGAAINRESHRELSSSIVKKEIEDALLRRARTDGQNISVEVDGGVVTLRGTVHTWSERELARQSAWGTPGVMTVQDNLTLFPS
jgi:osmotically-inducible protein OsmY